MLSTTSIAGWATPAGIYAGDCRVLSARAVLPALCEFERTSGSIIFGALSSALRRIVAPRSTRADALAAPSAFVAACLRASSVSFVNGTATLPRALARELTSTDGIDLLTRARTVALNVATPEDEAAAAAAAVSSEAVQHLPLKDPSAQAAYTDATADRANPRLIVTYDMAPSGLLDATRPAARRRCIADAVVCAVPAHELARILEGRDVGGNSSAMSEIRARTVASARAVPYATAGVACLGFRAGSLLPLDGFGYLVPSQERVWRAISAGGAVAGSRSAVLGVTWDSIVFPGQHAGHADAIAQRMLFPRRDVRTGGWLPTTAADVSPRSRSSETRVTVMFGGNDTLPNDLEAAAIRTLREDLGVRVSPDSVVTSVATQAIPQYTVGHIARADIVATGVAKIFSGAVLLAGNAWRGIGVTDTVATATAVGSALGRQVPPAESTGTLQKSSGTC